LDYEVFLISRIREHWLTSHDNQGRVATGLSQTARVITCASMIMASVFLAFLLSSAARCTWERVLFAGRTRGRVRVRGV
jgi:uncharacterized membrane protein YdfJ with MMPL/SSD domain